MARAGERNLFEGGLRFAQAIKNKNGHDVCAYKINLYALQVKDWEANNYEPISDSRVPPSNPGRFDAVNIYGDEYFYKNNFIDPEGKGRDLFESPGLGNFYRHGYRETDLVDYNTKNYKANIAFHCRTKPSLGFDSPLLILSSGYGAGTTVYQGDNRFSLKDISFFQNKIEFSKPDKFFIRAYQTYESAGKSYDPYFTALRLLELNKSNDAWNIAYSGKYWLEIGKIPDRMRALGYPKIIINPWPEPASFDFDAARQWLIQYADSLAMWHSQAAAYADLATGNDPSGSNDFFVPGTARFDSVFQQITTTLNNEQGGTRFSDKSALYHVSGEYIFNPEFFSEVRVGGNYRLYTPKSKGTIFSDTSGTKIINSEVGFYVGVKKKFFDQKIIASATIRFDKNANLKWIYTPAASLIYNPIKGTSLHISYSSALRNPTLTDQYLYLNVGPAILSGHVDKVDSLITVESFPEYIHHNDYRRLVYFDIDPIRPERVRTLELGGRTTLFKSLDVDLTFYLNHYRDFLGYLIGISADIDTTNQFVPTFRNFHVYRYSANTKNKVTTEGFSIGINYFISHTISFNGNYSYNKLTKTVEEDPIIPAYNTPAHKFNIGITGRDIKLSQAPFFRQVGFNINYKWVDGFRFEGSPQFTGQIPTYGIFDGQVNVHLEKSNTIIKIGGSNLLNNKHFETYGGAKVGRLVYISCTYNF
jgi:hypothetical protein